MNDKKAIREIYKEIRERETLEERKRQEEMILSRLEKHPRFLRAERIFLYHAHGSEFPTEGIAALARSFGKDLAFPKVEGRKMVFYQGGHLAKGFKGIFEPVDGEIAIPRKEDLMLLPGLAFTKEGERLGYGGGYYDRYLADCKERPFLMGLAFSCQIADALPSEPHDIQVDELL
ncbi:MAG: 5-formyltetrahydrofolate cyclo-ligase [Clostridia bacterium]|nr:5-formyltetrahydrofolate cyclo-ligase [Clostridia bacterium]